MKIMNKNQNLLKINCLRVLLVGILVMLAVTPGCKTSTPNELYHFFQDNKWNRFNKLSFELTVEDASGPVDVIFFGNFTNDFAYETLDFNMILKTPSGEERINEYQLKIKNSDGSFSGKQIQSGYYYELALKRGLSPGKTGKMVIEIENLVPRLVTSGIEGVGVRLVPAGK